jgi:hypothetical protein
VRCLRAFTYTTGGQVTHHPLSVTITLLLVREHGLVGVTEREVERLGREVTDDVGSVTTPEREDTLLLGGTAEALSDTVVLAVKTTGLEHLILERRMVSGDARIRCMMDATYLVLDEELDTLDGGGGGLRDSGRDTTHWRQAVSTRNSTGNDGNRLRIDARGQLFPGTDGRCDAGQDVLKKSTTKPCADVSSCTEDCRSYQSSTRGHPCHRSIRNPISQCRRDALETSRRVIEMGLTIYCGWKMRIWPGVGELAAVGEYSRACP